jgi:RimJ/RimL family protein N-acetyltransferase
MLRGERVVLRTVEREDVDRLWELLEDIEVAHRVSNSPPLFWSKARWEAEVEGWAEEPDDTAARFVIEVDGEVIGQCQLQKLDYYRGLCDLGISLGRLYWGQGFGQDAVRILLRYAFRYLNMRKVCLEVLADDERAVGAYRKAGFVEEGRLRQQAWFEGAYADALVMAVLREEWKEAEG